MERTQSYLEAIHKATASLVESAGGLNATLYKICEAITSIPVYKHAYISIYHDETKSFEVITRAGLGRDLVRRLDKLAGFKTFGVELKLSYEENIAIRAAKARKILTSNDLWEIIRPLLGKRTSRAIARLLGISSYAAVPLFVNDQLVGGMFVTSSESEISAEMLGPLQTFAHAAALVLGFSGSAARG